MCFRLSYPVVVPNGNDMKLLAWLVCGVVAIAARAEDQMRWSSNPDPLDAGAIDGAYYADLMATHGVRKVEFDVVSAKEMLNPRWNSDEHEADEYALSFTFGFNQEAANRGMIGPDGKLILPGAVSSFRFSSIRRTRRDHYRHCFRSGSTRPVC